jgi:hypothetical protein
MKPECQVVPQQIHDPYFFTENQVQVCLERYLEEEYYFSYEILYFNGGEVENSPWSNRENAVKDVLEYWEMEQEKITELYKSRNKHVHMYVKKGLCLFYMLLFWSNSAPVVLSDWQHNIATLSLKPVNAEERLLFIRQNPKLYHSFVQLKELFQEQHKQFAKGLAISKLKKDKK